MIVERVKVVVGFARSRRRRLRLQTKSRKHKSKRSIHKSYERRRRRKRRFRRRKRRRQNRDECTNECLRCRWRERRDDEAEAHRIIVKVVVAGKKTTRKESAEETSRHARGKNGRPRDGRESHLWICLWEHQTAAKQKREETHQHDDERPMGDGRVIRARRGAKTGRTRAPETDEAKGR